MDFFNSGLFWFLEGIFACLAVIGFKFWMEDRKIPMPFWKWILLGTWFFFFGFTIRHAHSLSASDARVPHDSGEGSAHRRS